MVNLDAKHNEIFEFLKSNAPFTPDTAVVLGSGLGNLVKKLKIVSTINVSDIPGYPASTVQGHKGFIHFAESFDEKLLIFQGRVHYYEGYSMSNCLVQVFLAKKLGCKNLLLTNAAGGINSNFAPGDLMLIKSLNYLNIKKELTDVVGLANLEAKNRMPDFPSSRLNSLIIRAALDENVHMKEGNYWYVKGPSYETPAEIQMMKKLGYDAVGMSTVHEAIYASMIGLEVAGISCITNFAAGLSNNKLSHDEVSATARVAEDKFQRLLLRVFNLI